MKKKINHIDGTKEVDVINTYGWLGFNFFSHKPYKGDKKNLGYFLLTEEKSGFIAQKAFNEASLLPEFKGRMARLFGNESSITEEIRQRVNQIEPVEVSV